MIKEKEITVKVGQHRYVEYYKKKGYNAELNKEFVVDPYDLPEFSKTKITAICENCERETNIEFNKYKKNYKRRNFYCCKKCSTVKREMTSMEKYGVKTNLIDPETQEKIKQTNLKIYGYESIFSSPEFRKQIEDGNLIKYGTKNVFSSPEIQKKSKQTNQKLYGTDYALSSPVIREKIKQTTKENHGVDHYSKTDEFKNKIRDTWELKTKKKLEEKYNIFDYNINKETKEIEIFCEDCKKYYITTTINLYQRTYLYDSKLCTICNPLISSIADAEIKIKNFIETYNSSIEILTNVYNIIGKKELDLYFPKFNIAVEHDGVYWHSDEYKTNDYHLNKTTLCKEKGIELIHIWGDEFQFKEDAVKSYILNKLGIIKTKINADLCEIRIPTKKEIKDFISINGLNTEKYNRSIGLYYNNELIYSVLLKVNINNEYKILNFVTKNYIKILDAEKKLINYILNLIPTKLVGISDKSKSSNKIYEDLGFKYIKTTLPKFFFVRRKKRSDNKKTSYKIYNCGYDIYELKLFNT